MKKLLRMLGLAVALGGAIMVGYSLSVGYRRGFSVDLDGNWDPVLIGITGAVIAASGMLAYFFFTHAEAGTGRRRAFLAVGAKALRSMAVFALTLCEYGGIVAAVVGFIMFLALERSGHGGIHALLFAVCGIVANFSAARLLSWAKGDDQKPTQEVAAVFDDRDD